MVQVLVVDDTRFMRTILVNILTEEGFEIVGEAEDGQQAVELYLKTKPDLILMDIIMPKMDGMMALKAILGVNPAAKVIMVTAIQSVEMAKLAFKCGALSYIIKPFQKQGILQEIDKVLHQ
ncbi:response regulator [Methanospirillum hungatei]|uniref:response regulator n=1 Tax=Methanospirillum hungatei TaxID=2203 RepID=UPI0009D10DD0|nr:response regulator [Methanospirillum hungatei]MBP9009010.1 response regulator [Methanospirillum sp.]OQA54123.1 MAG: acetoacetate metabolism regulatory protein AtoC [Euryarchaeota archaeon ADurb.Bin294]HOW04063.1 response regulator [Methanospirillum hungatei]